MSKTIAFTQAKARLSELMDRVSKGEEFLITRHDRIIARLGPARGHSREEVSQAVEDLKRLRRGVKVTLDEIIAWKNEGRP